MLVVNIIFYIIAFLTIISALATVLSKNPMTSILWMVFLFINTSVLMLLIGSEFVAFAMIIVYAGAIAVLFIFIIMLLNIKIAIKKRFFTKNFIIGTLIIAIIFAEVITFINVDLFKFPALINSNLHIDSNNPYNLSYFLFNNYGIIIILIGLILTITAIGIIFMINYSSSNKSNVYKQNMKLQVLRKPEDTIQEVNVKSEEGINSGR